MEGYLAHKKEGLGGMCQLWAAVERGRNTSNNFKDVHLKNGSSQGPNLALTVICAEFARQRHAGDKP